MTEKNLLTFLQVKVLIPGQICFIPGHGTFDEIPGLSRQIPSSWPAYFNQNILKFEDC